MQQEFALIIDTETQGLPEDSTALPIQIAALLVRRADLSPVGLPWVAYLAGEDGTVPACPDDSPAARVNGLTRSRIDRDIEDGARVVRASDVWQAIDQDREDLQRLWTGELPVVGWNLPFDLAMLDRVARRPSDLTTADPMPILAAHLGRRSGCLALGAGVTWAACIEDSAAARWRDISTDAPAHTAAGDCWRTLRVLSAMAADGLVKGCDIAAVLSRLVPVEPVEIVCHHCKGDGIRCPNCDGSGIEGGLDAPL